MKSDRPTESDLITLTPFADLLRLLLKVAHPTHQDFYYSEIFTSEQIVRLVKIFYEQPNNCKKARIYLKFILF